MAVLSFGSFQTTAFETFGIGIVGLGVAAVVSLFAMVSIAVARCSAPTLRTFGEPGLTSSIKKLEP